MAKVAYYWHVPIKELFAQHQGRLPDVTEMCVTAVLQEHGGPVCNLAGTLVSGDWW